MATLVCRGQAGDPAVALQQALRTQMPLTKATADRAGVVTAGTVLVLQKDGLMVYPSSLPAAPQSSYKNGKLSQGFGDTLAVDMVDGPKQPGGSSAIPKKKLVAGEKFWLIDDAVKKDKIELGILTEPYDDGRYFGVIKIPFAKGSTPSAEEMFRMIAEVVTVQPSDAATAAPPPPSTATASSVQPPPPPAMAPIAPPPPPADTPPPPPKSIGLGQTVDQVTANFGAPSKTVKLGTKDIYFYPDMKVTFVNGKVTDVQ
jgi:hypothetical protein